MWKWCGTSQGYCTLCALAAIAAFIYMAFSIEPLEPTSRQDQQYHTIGTTDEHSNERPKGNNEWKMFAQWWQWTTNDAAGFYTFFLAIFTAALFIVAGIQAGLFVWQLLLIKESLGDAQIAAKAARTGARGTLETVKVLRNAQRPFLSPFDPKLHNFDQAVHSEDASVVMMTVELDITNVGTGIGFIRSYEIIHEVCPRDSQGTVCLQKHEHIARYPLRPEATWILEDTKFTFYAFRIDNDQRKDMRENRNVLYLYGNVRYWDLFPVNRRTGFMFEYIPNWESPKKGVFVMCPHTMWYDIEEEPEAQSSGA